MRAIIQRVSSAKVVVDQATVGEIQQGLLLLLGYENEDTVDDLQWICQKIVQMRIFGDEEGKMNLSLIDLQGEILAISQFTLHASTKKGNRPSFIRAGKSDHAERLYLQTIEQLQLLVGKEKVQKGIFGADMKVSLVNDGPVTIFIDSKNKE